VATLRALAVLRSGDTRRRNAIGNLNSREPAARLCRNSWGISVPHFIAETPVFDPPEFDADHVKEAHEMAPAQGEIE
jgi:hypothetical protein